ncbi:MAG: hypothetical protein U0Q16_18730 [Bryobacteraceae bacterium]
MTTGLKTETNRANAQHSTGPRTEQGKAVSSKNAVTHGLFSATFAVAPEDREEFDIFLELQRGELRPHGINEELVFANLVQAAWKTETCRRMEANALLEQNEANLAGTGRDGHESETHVLSQLRCAAERIDKYSRYSARFERAYYRALAELRRLQTERGLRDAAAAQPSENRPPVADIGTLRKQTQPLPDLQNEAFCRRLDAESRWTMAKLRALKAGIPITDSGLAKAA